MKKHGIEWMMACLLLLGFLFLSREAAEVTNQKSEKKIILVDAGHGGVDPGMIGVGGLKEKEINLSIAKKLKQELEKNNFTVIMTREQDEGLYEEGCRNKKVQDMQNRIALIQKEKPLLSVSIHQNSYQDEAVFGPQVFYYQDSVQGKKLGEILQRNLNEKLAVARPREAKGNTSYYLLKRSPGVLAIIECGFLTNSKEAKNLQAEEYQWKVVKAIVSGICAYIREIEIKSV